MQKFIVLANVTELSDVKKLSNIGIFVSYNLPQLSFLKVCESRKKHTFIYDENMNVRRVNVQNFYSLYDQYKHSKSFIGNVLGFDITEQDHANFEKVRNILGVLNNTKYAYAKFLSSPITLPKQLTVANTEATCFEVLAMKDLSNGLLHNARGFEFLYPKDFFQIKKMVAFLRRIEKCYFFEQQNQASDEISVLGDGEYRAFANGAIIRGTQKDGKVLVTLNSKRKFILYTLKKTKHYFAKEIEFDLDLHYPACISLM